MSIKLQRRTILAISVGLTVTACGGGGGGGGNPYHTPTSSYVRSNVPYHTPVSVGSYQPLTSIGISATATDIFARDLNNDNVDEVVFAGRMSQPATVATWKNYNMQVMGWNTGGFSNETSRWFSNNDNVILGTEPSIKFGDFNGDGRVDMFVASSTDMAHYGPGAVYLNGAGDRFSRQDLNFGAWSHDSAVTDLNGDGYADIVVTDYGANLSVAFGSASGTFTTNRVSFATKTSASSISVADYLVNGSRTIIMTDVAPTGVQDTALYSWQISGGELVLTKVSDLPASRFYLPKWDQARSATAIAPHEIRNISMDFNRDGKMDVIVFSTLPKSPDNNHGYSEVQFLRNDGAGQFTDVTDTILVDFNTEKNTTYNPVLIDVNNDGLLDILMSAADYTAYNSTTVLIQTREGVFAERYASVFKDFWNQIVASTANANTGWGNTISIINGPNNVKYLVSTVNFTESNTTKTAVYLAKIGSFGTVTAEASIATLQQAWPWMSVSTANAVLAQTAETNFAGYDSNLHGNGILDLDRALRPIGGLGISLDGRDGTRKPITGGIFVPGFDSKSLGRVVALDDMRRNFTVNMSSMGANVSEKPISWSQISAPAQSWSSRFISNNLTAHHGFSAAQSADGWTTGVSFRIGGYQSPYVTQIAVSQMQGSPWMAWHGIFGRIDRSLILDASISRIWSQGFWLQTGSMQTTTYIDPGLVDSVSPLYSIYAVMGYQEKNWQIYAGLQPTIVHGDINLRLPNRVDNRGVLHYSSSEHQVRNDQVFFAGAERSWTQSNHTWKISGVANSTGAYQTGISYSLGFK